jgi:hypothetical protein
MGSIFGVTMDVLTLADDQDELRLNALNHHDHLLRRFGSADLIEFGSEYSPSLRLRKEADEIWILFSGSALLRMMDTRPESPTHGELRERDLTAPARVLVPFGVAAGWRPVKAPVQLLCISTHADSESPPQTLEWEAA